MTEHIFTVLSILLGGTNILSLFLWKQERQKAQAEAEAVNIENKRKNFELAKDQADTLMASLDKVNKEYIDLQTELRETTARYSNEILDKCRTIADLKAQVVYFKNLRCYRSACAQRIATNPDSHATNKTATQDNNAKGE